MVLLLVMTCATLWAQKAGKNNRKGTDRKTGTEWDKDTRRKKVLRPVTYLGHTDFSGGSISYQLFDSLLKQGLYTRDSGGTAYKIVSFLFNYAERKVYEDSVGNMVMMVDLSSEPCFGNKVDSAILNMVDTRMKGGDTVYIERILLTQEHNQVDTFLGKGMKCVITK